MIAVMKERLVACENDWRMWLISTDIETETIC